ncbi:hypothetical protein [Planomonospora sp. ID82291]|uniref:hypothetical protein n=1 Tax=Planomonospora sp. ID82291 TaxID=2738136 RepID=UPI0018C3CCC5|nr:hypothetical protein [Planomonospora sp. ID82291]MBG0814064.1 hypothetical protein [Planomonospora sp. ID82291]
MDEAWYRLGMLLTLAAGIWEGPMAVIFRLFTDKEPNILTAANYLPEPWCYVAAAGATVAALAVIAVLDARHKRVTASREDRP